jgi:hypothetical protein
LAAGTGFARACHIGKYRSKIAASTTCRHGAAKQHAKFRRCIACGCRKQLTFTIPTIYYSIITSLCLLLICKRVHYTQSHHMLHSNSRSGSGSGSGSGSESGSGTPIIWQELMGGS